MLSPKKRLHKEDGKCEQTEETKVFIPEML